MSRNLGTVACYYCACSNIVYEEPVRPITRDDAGYYIDEYHGCTVAKAHCYECEARYLGWFDKSAHDRRYGWHSQSYDAASHCDLSFQSTFDDEPGAADLPRWEIEVIRQRKRLDTCAECGIAHAKAVSCCYARPR